MIASIPPTIERVCFDKKSNVCRLPFHEQTGKISKRGTNKSTMDKENESRTKSKLNRQLHDEHRVFFANLKTQRQRKFELESVVALVIQRCVRGFLLRKRLNPDKHEELRDSVKKKWTKEEILRTVEEVIRRSGVISTENDSAFLGVLNP